MLANRQRLNIAALQIRLDRPERQRRHAAPAGHQLHHGHGQLGGAARRVDAGRAQHLADQIQLVVWHRVGDQGFAGKVGGAQPGFAGQRMVARQHGHHFIAKQRVVAHGGFVFWRRHHRQVGAAAEQQAHRVGMKARHDIQLHLGPVATKIVHRRHQPVKTGVALHGNAQLAGLALGNARQLAFGLLHLRQHAARQGVQPLAGGGERQRLAAAIHQRAAVVAFQGFQLVRQRRLGKIQPAGGGRDIAAFGQRQQGAQVAQFKQGSRHGVLYEFCSLNSSK